MEASVMKNNEFNLSELEREALKILCDETFASCTLMDSVSFRADHPEFRQVMRRLSELRYIDEDYSTQTYNLTVLGLKEVGCNECRKVLELGSLLLGVFHGHYKNRLTRKSNLPLKDIAARLGIERHELDFSIIMLSNLLSLTSSGYTTNLRTDDAWVLPSESVYDYETIDDVVAVYEGYRDRALNGSNDMPQLHPNLAQANKLITSPFGKDLLEALPEKFHEILKEIKIAYANNLTCLSVTGLRAVIDEFATDQVGDVGGFERKIAVMVEKKLLNDNQVDILKAALEVGHATAHRMHVPSDEECRQVLEIVMHLLREVYVLHPTARHLKDSAPPRA